MRSYRIILVPLDFSECSQDLIDQAVALADDSTEVVLLHVAELPRGLAATANLGRGSGSAETAEELLVRRSSDRLAAYRKLVAAQGLEARAEVVRGRTAEAILAKAEECRADLIVMGTHGRRGLAKVLWNSVAAEVVARARCPVLTLRTTHKATCAARSCDRCDGHITSELGQLMVERDG